MSSRPTREEVYLGMCEVLSQRSTCARRQVACILTDKRGRILSTGYNGVPSGWPHCTDKPCAGASAETGEDLDKCEAIHAEINALLQCPDTSKIYVAYVTDSPCVHCLKALLNTGCQRIIFSVPYAHDETWRMWMRAGRLWEQGKPLIEMNRTFRSKSEA